MVRARGADAGSPLCRAGVFGTGRAFTTGTMKSLLFGLLFGLCALLASPCVLAASAGLVGVGVGDIGVLESGNHGVISLEWQSGNPWIGPLKPWVTIALTARSAGYVGTGLELEWPLSRHWRLIPSFGPVIYWHGHGLRLGEALEFRSRVEIAYVFGDGQRIALSVAHISNGGLDDYNPGTQTAELLYYHPL